MPPQWPDLILATDIPYSELDVLVLNSLNVEAWRRELGSEVWMCRG